MTLSDSVSQLLKSHNFLMAKIHSVYPNGFNLQWEDHLIFIGRQSQDLSAFGLQLEDTIIQSLTSRLQVGQLVKLSYQQLTIYLQSQIINIQLTSPQIVDLTLTVNQPFTDAQLERLAQDLKSLDIWEQSGFQQVSTLGDWLNHWRLGQFSDRALVYHLIGAGMGLTPSGDDFLQGMILCERLTDSAPYWELLVRELLMERSTTQVSQAYYSALLEDHQVNRQWLQLVAAISQDDWQAVPNVLRQIQHYGETSGSDLLLGIQEYIQWHYRRLTNE